MTKWLYLAAGVVVFGAGYVFADALRTADIERLKADYAQAVLECPPAPAVPASLVSDKSQNVAGFLQRVQAFLKKAAAWSEGSTPTGQPSWKR